MPSKKKQKTNEPEPEPVPQTAAERQQLRMEQRALADKIIANKNDIGNVNSEAFNEMRKANNLLEKRVTGMRESTLDVANHKAITFAASKQASALIVINQSISIDKLVRELRKRVVDDEEQEDFQWGAIGKGVSFAFATPPHIEFLCGPLSKPPQEKKERKRTSINLNGGEEDSDSGEEESPEDVNDVDEVEESTQKRIKELSKKLCETHEEKNFFNFLVNPNSFTQTVENVFDFSFLIKKGDAALSVDESGSPMISTVDENRANEEIDKSEQKSHQIVIAFSPRDMREVIEHYNIDQSTSGLFDRKDDPTYQNNYEGNLRGNNKNNTTKTTSKKK